MTPLNDVLERAKEYREVVARRAIAHEKSAEWHRKRGARLGVGATILSAVVGTAIFATITSQLSLAGEKATITLPRDGWATLLYLLVFAALILAPVLTGVHTHVNDPEQAEKHKRSWGGYYQIQQRLDLFLLRYADASDPSNRREKAIDELEVISREIKSLCDESITLTSRAYANAEEEIKKRGNSEPLNNYIRSELLRVGICAAISAAGAAALIAWFNGPVWYAIGPLVVFTAYAIKLTVKKRRDEPRAVMAVLVVVSLAMIVFAWFNRNANI